MSLYYNITYSLDLKLSMSIHHLTTSSKGTLRCLTLGHEHLIGECDAG